MSQTRLIRLAVTLVVATFMLAACGGSGTSSGTSNKGTITVAGFNFPESSILANIYGKALAKKGWTVKYKLNLGAREVVEPALEKGDIDLYPGYAATDTTFLKGKPTTDVTQTIATLNGLLSAKNLKALSPSPAQDQNAFAMTAAGAAKFGNPKKLSDLKDQNGKLVLGAGPECPVRDYCKIGLEGKYGLKFKAFKALDTDGPLTRAALDKGGDNGGIDLGLVFSADGDLKVKHYVILADDLHLQNTDNVTPIIRTATVNSDAQAVLDDVSSKLITDDLVGLNQKVQIDKSDPDQVAQTWLSSHGY